MTTMPEAVREAATAAIAAERPDLLERLIDGLLDIARNPASESDELEEEPNA